MSLRSVVEKVRDDMLQEASRYGPGKVDVAGQLQRFADMLTLALEASQGESTPSARDPVLPRVLDRRELLAREELAQQIRREEAGTGMVVIQGGPDDGALCPIDPAMPVGAKTLVAGRVYQLGQDRKLHLEGKNT